MNLTLMVFLALIGFVASSYADQKCASDEHWVKAHQQSSYYRSDGTFVSGSFRKAHCQKNPLSYAVWKDRLKPGVPNRWEYKKEKAKNWTESERERVLEALSVLPDDLLLKSVNGIYRLESFLEYPLNPAANHEHSIVLYDEAFKSKYNLARVLSHEFAHILYRQFYDEDQGVGYANASDWMSVSLPSGAKMLVPNRDGFVEEDGKEGPSEDFSNNIEYFLFKPSELKVKAPKVYDWIRKKYGDKFRIGKEPK